MEKSTRVFSYAFISFLYSYFSRGLRGDEEIAWQWVGIDGEEKGTMAETKKE
jgi:hypothetical protein